MFDLQAFRVAFPEFANIPDSAVIFWGDFATKLWNKTVWGKWYVEAVFLYTAHRLAIAYDITEGLQANGMKDAADTSAITAKSASTNSLSVNNAVSDLQTGSDVIEVDLSRTNYGLLLLELIKLILPSARLVCSMPIGASVNNWYNGKWWPI